MFDNTLRTVTVDVDLMEYLIGNVYTCRNTKYCDLEAFMELAMLTADNPVSRTKKQLSERWKWSIARVTRFLNRLEYFDIIEMRKGYSRGMYYIKVLKLEESNGQRKRMDKVISLLEQSLGGQ